MNWRAGISAILMLLALRGSQMPPVPGAQATSRLATTTAYSTEMQARDCQATSPAAARPPDAHIASFAATWYRSLDGAIWAGKAGHWYAGANKVLWVRPMGEQLHLAGHRLDGIAPPLVAELPAGYEAEGYQPAGISFPTGGCWEVEARAGTSELRFVVEIHLRAYAPSAGSCASLADGVANATAIIEAQVAGSVQERPDFVWRSVGVKKTWKGPVAEGEHMEVLQEVREAPLLPTRSYLLFLEGHAGRPWRLLCGHRPLVEVDGERLNGPIWGERVETLAAFEERLSRLESVPAPRP